MHKNFYYKGILISLILAFFGGAYALESAGIKYISSGGSPLLKIHFYSYVILTMFSHLILTSGFSSVSIRLGDFYKVWLASLVCLFIAIIIGLVKFGTSGMAYLVDLFLSPLLMLAIVPLISINEKKKLLRLVGYLLIINCSIALVEFAGKFHFFEPKADVFGYFRSYAFLTHPLNNALISIAVIPFLLNVTRFPALLYFGLSLLALFAFGGRTALSIYLMAAFIISIPSIYKFFTSGILMSRLQFSLLFVVSQFGFAALTYLVLNSGIGDRIVENMSMEGGSSLARLNIIYLLEQLTSSEWLFGASDNLRNAIEIYLNASVIENYVVGWIFTFGLVGALPLLLTLLLPLYFFFIKGEWITKVTIFSFLIVAISNNSLNTKTPVLLFFYTVLMLHYYINKVQASNECSGFIKGINKQKSPY